MMSGKSNVLIGNTLFFQGVFNLFIFAKKIVMIKKILIYFVLLHTISCYSQITIHSKFSGIAKASGKGELEVQINKANINSFAKYQVEVPPGVLVSDIDVKGGNFLMEDGKGKVVWINLPSENSFTIKLKISFNDNINFPITLYQKFYYLENSVKKEVQAEPLIINTSETTIVQINKNENQNSENKNISTVISPDKNLSNANHLQSSKVNTEQSQNTSKNTTPKNTTQPDNNLNNKTAYTYKIQVAASATKPDISKYANLEKVEVVQHKGMYKVMIEKVFNSKEDALQYREQVVQKGYTGAFLVKYFNGQRVN